jgi:hypothetical protein
MILHKKMGREMTEARNTGNCYHEVYMLAVGVTFTLVLSSLLLERSNAFNDHSFVCSYEHAILQCCSRT